VALPLPVGSRAFLEAYHAALEAEPAQVQGKARAGTWAALVNLYYSRKEFADLAEGSKDTAISLIHLCGSTVTDSCASDGSQARRSHHARACRYTSYPIGSEQRLAFDLLLYTGQRVSDVVRMGRASIKDGAIVVKQKKTGADVTVPILPALKAVLDEVTKRKITPTFLVIQYGKARTPEGLSTMFKSWTQEAGLPDDCHAHGLRKSFAVIAAEAGLTTHQIAALTGHKTPAEVAKYTDAADRRRLAAEGMEKIRRGTFDGNPT
jgi:Phage integrase family